VPIQWNAFTIATIHGQQPFTYTCPVAVSVRSAKWNGIRESIAGARSNEHGARVREW
jgi:hypothetical protein